MQVKKEDLRESILEAAQKEFLNKGFKSASMRTIAKKANTTLGNIYNYFSNKEDILEAVVGDIPKEIERLIFNHRTHPVDITDADAVNQILEEMDPRELGIDIFLNPKFVILMESCQGTPYEKYRNELLILGKEHILKELKDKKKYERFAEVLTMTFFNGILFIAKSSDNLEEAKENFIRLFKMICTGYIKQCELGEDKND